MYGYRNIWLSMSEGSQEKKTFIAWWEIKKVVNQGCPMSCCKVTFAGLTAEPRIQHYPATVVIP